MNGEMAAPMSRMPCTLALRWKAWLPRACQYWRPWYDWSGSVNIGWRPAPQSNVPPSTITPPIEVPWPPMNFVAECTTMSAPHRSGW